MAFDEGLAERIREVVRGGPGITEKRMFGGLAFMAGDRMFVGIVRDALMVRVGPEDHDAALRRPHVRIMDFTGRPMKGFLLVDPPGLESDAELEGWIERSRQFVKTLGGRKGRAGAGVAPKKVEKKRSRRATAAKKKGGKKSVTTRKKSAGRGKKKSTKKR